MSLAGIVRKGVAVTHKVSKSVQENVQHVTWTRQDFMGAETTVTVVRKALVEQKLHLRRLSDGRMVAVQATLTFLDPFAGNGAANRVEPVDPKDKFILADGSSGPIVDTEGLRDPGKARPFFLQVFLGVAGSTNR